MLSLDDVLARLFALTTSLGEEQVPLGAACGRCLARPVTAQLTQPPFNASAMDGYALKAEDAITGRTLTTVGTAQAGASYTGTLAPGQCIRIFTGAPLPASTDTVIMQENVATSGDTITIQQGTTTGNNVRPKGQDFAKGEILIHPGTVLTPAHIALAAAANLPQVWVAKRPKIAILASGDELVPVGSTPTPDQIISSNSLALKALLAPFAQSITDLGIAPDNQKLLAECLADALNTNFDVLITSGGASVGDHDLIQPTLKSLGVDIDFWKLAIRPGKPLMAGKKGKCLVFGLPGNPVSSMVTAQAVVLPVLRKMLGHTHPLGPRLTLPLATPLPANGTRRHFMRAILTSALNGATEVDPIPITDSAHLSSLATADLLIVAPENAPAQSAGTLVECIPLWH